MVKITYSDDINRTCGVGGEIVKSASELGKQASTIFKCEYGALKPPKGMTGIHLVALGDYEHYGVNRNGDAFKKEACQKYYNTFVKNGHVFEHHRNKDPKKAIGQIKAAAYNEPMGRIELYIWADNEKAHDHLERLEKTGETCFSMACKIPYDVCMICGARRKAPGDENECDHVKYELGKVAEDGKIVGTFNPDPTWFDISFVGRPADRIAWSLKTASSVPIDSAKEAEYEGVVLPDCLAIESPSASRKLGYLRKLAEMHGEYRRILSGKSSSRNPHDLYMAELYKIASCSPDDDTLAALRSLEPSDAVLTMGDAGVILGPESFFKYAFGPEYKDIEKQSKLACLAVEGVIDRAVDSGSCSDLCNSSLFDASDRHDIFRKVPGRELLDKLAEAGFLDPWNMKEKAAEYYCRTKTAEASDNHIDREKEAMINSEVSIKLAEMYVKYKLSAIDAVMNGRPVSAGADGLFARDEDNVAAVSAAQDKQ